PGKLRRPMLTACQGYDKYRSMEPRLNIELKYDVPFLKGLSLKGSYSQRWSFGHPIPFLPKTTPCIE
ncbi:MAG: hypothetical protein AB2L24_03220, partial [Mangrovibacterium sp.]